LDKTYYQTVKGMVTPLDILEEGGRLIIASECSEGIGSEAFRSAQKNLVEQGPDSFLEGLTQKKLADIDEWQTEMQLKPMRIGSIQLFTTGLNEEDRKITGVGQVSSITEAISASIAEQGSAEVAVIPEGPYLVPFVQPQNQTDPIEPSLH
jgi:nickel-dependent lactate racemase